MRAGTSCARWAASSRALLERAHVGLGAHHADDARAAVDNALVEKRRGVQRLHPAFAQPLLEIALVLLCMDDRETESETLFSGDLFYDVAEPLDVRVAAGRADEERNLDPARADQHHSQIALHHRARPNPPRACGRKDAQLVHTIDARQALDPHASIMSGDNITIKEES